MTFESHKPNNQTATLATHARRTFTGFPAVLKRSVKSGKVGSQRAVCTEAVQKQASSPKHPVAEKRPSGSTAAPGFFEAETNNKRVKYSEDLEPITPTNHLESDIQAPRQSKAAQVFQSFFETDHIRDEEIRLICRRDRAVGVFAMVFWSLAAEGVGQGSASIAQAALSTAVLRFKDLKAFQDKLEAKQKKGAASAQAWFDDLAAQAKDQYEIFQASATEVSELASRKIGWKKSYAGLQNWLKPIVDPPASQPGRWTSWAAPRPVKKRAPAEQPQPVNLVFAAPAGGHSFKGEPKQGHKSAAAPEQRMSPASEAPTQVSSPTAAPAVNGKAAPCKPAAQPSLDSIKPQIEEGLQELPVSVPAVVLDQFETFQRAPAVPNVNMASGSQSARSAENVSTGHQRVQARHVEDRAGKHASKEHQPDAATPGKGTSTAAFPQTGGSTSSHASNAERVSASSPDKAWTTAHAPQANETISRHTVNEEKQIAPIQKTPAPAPVPAAARSTDSANGSGKVQQGHRPDPIKQNMSPQRQPGFASTASTWLNRHSPNKKDEKASSTHGILAPRAAEEASKDTQPEQDAGRSKAITPGFSAPAGQRAGSQEQTPVFQASAAAATAKKLESAAHPVPAALEPSKEEQGRAILDKETQRKKTGTTEVDDTSQLWLAAAKAADTTRTAEGRTTTPSKAWSAEGRQPGVPATAEAAAASGAQREAMQVRRPEQHHVTPHEKPTPQKEAAFAAANRPDTSHNPTAVAKSEMQPLKVAGSPSDQQSGHPQDTLVAASTRDAYTIQNKQAKEQPAKSHNPTSQLWMRAAAAAETARRAGTNSSTPASPATNGAKEPQHRSYSPATDTATATSQATSHKTPEQALHNIKTEHSPTHGISRDSNGMPPSVSTATIGRADDAPTTPGKRTLGALQQDRAAGRPSGQEAARQVKTGAGIALGGGGGDHSGGSSGGRGGGSGGGGSKKRRTGSGGGNEWVQPHRPSWHHWVLLILLFTAGALAVLSLRTAHDNREQNNQVKMRGGSLGLIAASIFLTFECGWPGA
ncbi:hypothetical protein WJX74_000524 [Apatococcus lobatus]|uniref:Uncharacterized protein n=1 Tax=Apatococcus lobatus TaxID=904363 RepID=A0AAW1QYC1_9CHLO